MIIGLCAKAGSGKDTFSDYISDNYGFIKIAFADKIKRILMDLYDFSPKNLWGPSEERNRVDLRYPIWNLPNYENEFEICSKNQNINKITHNWVLEQNDCFNKFCSECLIKFNNPDEYLTPRKAAQSLGDWGREQNKNYWVNRTFEIINKIISNNYSYNYQKGLIETINSSNKNIIITDIRYLNELIATKNHNGKIFKIIRSNIQLKGKLGSHSSEIEQDSIPDCIFDEIILNDGSLEDFYKKIDEIIIKYC